MRGREVVQGPRARRDLLDIFRHYSREAGPATARRFFAQAEATFDRLASLPGLGERYEPETPGLDDLRCATVARFEKYLVFYRPVEGGIEVIRVLHGARDIAPILADELGP